MSELTDVLIQNPDCVVREIGDGLAILAPGESAAHSLEDVGAFIWGLFDGHLDLAAIVSAITDEYEVDDAQAQTDLLEFADELIRAGVVQKA